MSEAANGRFSPLVGRIAGRASQAWDLGEQAWAMMAAGRDVIHLGVGDPDMDIAAPVRAALDHALDTGRTHYSPLAGETGLRSAIAAHASALYHVPVAAEEVIVCAGAQGALYAVLQVVAGPGDEVIVPAPHYTTYPACVAASGARMVNVPLDQPRGYQPDLAAIAAAITPRTRAILINSPGNPSGAVFDAATMAALVALAEAHDIWLISDEVYWSLCYDGPHAPALTRAPAEGRVIVINSLSKSHAMTGCRIGWAIGPQDLIEALALLAQVLYFGISQFVQDAAAVALADLTIPPTVTARFRERRDALVAALRAEAGLEFSAPAGGMFLLVDVSATGLDGAAFAAGLLEAEGVAIVPGFGFGEAAEGLVRIGFLAPPERLAEAARRIGRYRRTLG